MMAMKSVVSRTGLRRLMESSSAAQRSSISGLRYFSDGKGRVLGEEERAQETIYIQKMERERLEKAKQKAEREKAEKEKADKGENFLGMLEIHFPHFVTKQKEDFLLHSKAEEEGHKS